MDTSLSDVQSLPTRQREDVCIGFLRNKVLTSPSEYSWLKPILDSTLDEDARQFLVTHPPRLGNYPPNGLYEQIESASRILEICLVQRQSIHSLEMTAILSALDLEHALKTNLLNAEIERQRIRYFAKTSSQAELVELDPAETALNERTAAIEASLLNKLALHGKEGSALNYGERTLLLRYMYKENIRSCYERLDAIRKGMATLYFATLPKPPHPATTKNHALAMIRWMRIAMDIVDRAKPYERTTTKTLLVGKHPSDIGSDLKPKLQQDEAVRFRFSIGPMEFVDLDEAMETTVVLQDLSVAWLFDDNWDDIKALATETSAHPTDQTKQGNLNVHRLAEDLANAVKPKLLSNIVLSPPQQHVRLEDLPPSEKSWQPAPLLLWEIASWNSGAPTLDARQNLNSSLLHCSPMGNWEVFIPTFVRIGSVTLPRSQIRSLIPTVPGGADKKAVLSDLMLTLSLLVLPRMKPDDRLVRAFEEDEK